MSDYSKLSKAELLKVIEELEQNQLSTKLQVLKREFKLLGEDLIKAVAYVYELGYKAGEFVHGLIPARQDIVTPVLAHSYSADGDLMDLDLLLAQIRSEDVDTVFEY